MEAQDGVAQWRMCVAREPGGGPDQIVRELTSMGFCEPVGPPCGLGAVPRSQVLHSGEVGLEQDRQPFLHGGL